MEEEKEEEEEEEEEHHDYRAPVEGAEVGRELLFDVPLAQALCVVPRQDAYQCQGEGNRRVIWQILLLLLFWLRCLLPSVVTLLHPLLVDHVLVCLLALHAAAAAAAAAAATTTTLLLLLPVSSLSSLPAIRIPILPLLADDLRFSLMLLLRTPARSSDAASSSAPPPIFALSTSPSFLFGAGICQRSTEVRDNLFAPHISRGGLLSNTPFLDPW